MTVPLLVPSAKQGELLLNDVIWQMWQPGRGTMDNDSVDIVRKVGLAPDKQTYRQHRAPQFWTH